MGEFEDQFGDEFEEEEVWEDVEETEGADMEMDNADEPEKPKHQVFVPGKSDVEPNADLEYDSSAYALIVHHLSGTGYGSSVRACGRGWVPMRVLVVCAARVCVRAQTGACLHARVWCVHLCRGRFVAQVRDVPPVESRMAVHDLRFHPRRPWLSANQVPDDRVRLLRDSGVEPGGSELRRVATRVALPRRGGAMERCPTGRRQSFGCRRTSRRTTSS